jgi:succinate dehydrogenase / fumarate reductase membrane anchor subunit
METNIHKKNKAAAHVVGEWFEERVLAIFSIPLLLWLILQLIWVYKYDNCYESFADFVQNPLNASALIMFLAFFLKYLFLSMKVVFEDYVHCECVKLTLILGMKFLGIFAFVIGTLAVVKIFVN